MSENVANKIRMLENRNTKQDRRMRAMRVMGRFMLGYLLKTKSMERMDKRKSGRIREFKRMVGYE